MLYSIDIITNDFEQGTKSTKVQIVPGESTEESGAQLIGKTPNSPKKTCLIIIHFSSKNIVQGICFYSHNQLNYIFLILFG